MRTIKFRGKRIDDGEWMYGYYFKTFRTNQHTIRCGESEGVLVDSIHEVLPESVGQFTGLKDKNGKEIYGGGYS